MTEQLDRVNIQYVKGFPSPWTGTHLAADNTFNLTVSLPPCAPVDTVQVVCADLCGDDLQHETGAQVVEAVIAVDATVGPFLEVTPTPFLQGKG